MQQKLWFILFFCWFNGKLWASIGFPIIINYSSDDMKVTPQVWSIVQDEQGQMYFATNVGVLRFNGVEWDLFETPNNSPVRSMAIDKNNIIYVGATRQFGYLKPKANGAFHYVSLSDSLKNETFKAVLKTFVVGDTVYFFANHEHIYKYYNGKVNSINMGSIGYFRAFKVDNEIYLLGDFGLATLVNDSVVIKDSNHPPGNVYFLLPYETHAVIAGTLRDGIYLYHHKQNQWEKFNSEIDEWCRKGDVYNGILLQNGNYAISTLKQGMVIISHNGKLLHHFNNKSGIINNGIYYIFEDKHKDLWVGQEKGISHIELSTPFTTFGSKSGLEGTMQNAITYNGKLYCATSSGLLYYDIERLSDNKFRYINSNYIYNLDFCKVKIPGAQSEILIASFLRDLMWVTPNNKLQELLKIYGCYAISVSPNVPGRLYLGTPEGLEYVDLKMKNGHVEVIGHQKIKRISESIRQLVFDDHGNLWVRSGFNTIFKVYLGKHENPDSIKYQVISDIHMKYNDLVINQLNYIDKTIYLATNYGILSHHINTNNKNISFTKETNLGIDFKKDSLEVISLSKDKMGNFWIGLNKGLVKYDLKNNELLSTKYRRLSDRKVKYIKSLDQLGIVVLTEDEIFFVNDAGLPRFDFNVLIKKVTLGNKDKIYCYDSVKSHHMEISETISKNYKSINIAFAAPFYQKALSVTYDYFLEGFDKTWTYNSENRQVTYTNLPHGDYTFFLKATNIYNNQSDTVSLSFKIETPWYLRTISIVAFVIIFMALVYAMILIYTYRLKKEGKRLQEIIKKAIHNEKQQKEEIERQAKQLIDINKELENLSLVASKTDSGVVIMDALGKIQWVNPGYSKMYGYKLYDMLHKEAKIIGDHANISIDEMVNVWFGERKPIIYENQKETKDGRKMWVQTTLTPIIDDNNRLLKLIAIDSDISKLKQAEAEIEAQKDEIEAQRDLALQQRDEISVQKKEIVDSIKYAYRIQNAILLDEIEFGKIFPNAFLYNRPRDIVSGDFYWAYQNDTVKIITCVDCTGHGVPGAFMSLIGVTYLNYIVKEIGVYEPAEILNHLRNRVIKSLGQTGKENEAKDGMDLSLCVIYPKTKKLVYAGANNASYLIKNKSDLLELKADKMPISIFHAALRSFKQGEIDYNPGDRLYLFTDGYADQFGGMHQKKYKLRRLKDFLLKIQHLPIADQRNALDEEHCKWRKNLNQVDDILILGVELE